MVIRSNPYSPPSPQGSRSTSPGGAAESWLSSLLVAQVLVSAFRIALYGQAFSGWDVLGGGGDWVETASRVSWLASLLLVPPTLMAYSVWIYRWNRAVRASRPGALEFTPAWCVAVCFVPVVNLVAPYRAVDEIRAAVAPGARAAVRVWWAFWIASLAFGLVSRFSSYGEAAWRAPVHDALWAASALALLSVARSIRRGLDASPASRREAA